MSRNIVIIVATAVSVVALLLLGGCGESTTRTPGEPTDDIWLDGLSFGSDGTVDVLTWNMKGFPMTGSTVDYLIGAVERLEPDLVGFQEIEDEFNVGAFADVLDGLEGYDGFLSDSDYYINLAWLWRTETVIVDDVYEIYQDDGTAFPRHPLVVEAVAHGTPMTLINNHFKAQDSSDDDVIDWGDYNDTQFRRALACQLLDQWVDAEKADEAVVILGDLNDSLTDIHANVFEIFLDDPDHWRFADMDIATGPVTEFSYWSRTFGYNHLDHILVSDELFAGLEEGGPTVETIRVDHYLRGGLSEYHSEMSDHLPVGMRLDLSE